MPGFATKNEGAGLVEISGSDVNIVIPRLAKGQKIAFEAMGTDVRLHTKQGILPTEMSVYHGHIVSPFLEEGFCVIEKNHNRPPQRVITLSQATKANPVSLDWELDSSVIINNLLVNAISFWRDVDKDGILESTVLSGNVNILPTNDRFPLSIQDEVKLVLSKPAYIKMLKTKSERDSY